MPFGLAVQSANRLRRLARMKLEKAEQETGRALAESQEPESRKHFGDPGRSAEHKVPMDPLPSSYPFLHRASLPCQPTFPQSVDHRARPEADTHRLTAPVG